VRYGKVQVLGWRSQELVWRVRMNDPLAYKGCTYVNPSIRCYTEDSSMRSCRNKVSNNQSEMVMCAPKTSKR